jgi:hypothetical protein
VVQLGEVVEFTAGTRGAAIDVWAEVWHKVAVAGVQLCGAAKGSYHVCGTAAHVELRGTSQSEGDVTSNCTSPSRGGRTSAGAVRWPHPSASSPAFP